MAGVVGSRLPGASGGSGRGGKGRAGRGKRAREAPDQSDYDPEGTAQAAVQLLDVPVRVDIELKGEHAVLLSQDYVRYSCWDGQYGVPCVQYKGQLLSVYTFLQLCYGGRRREGVWPFFETRVREEQGGGWRLLNKMEWVQGTRRWSLQQLKEGQKRGRRKRARRA